MGELDFGALLERTHDVVAVFDRGHRYVYVNAAFERRTGAARTALLGRRNQDVMQPEDAARWREALDDVLSTGRERTIECTLQTPRGVRRFESTLTGFPGERVCSVSRDITDLTEARRAHDAAVYLAAAGPLLERFEPETSLQTIVDLAVPAFADWCFIHLATDGEARVAAIAHADAEKVAVTRARTRGPAPTGDSAVVRVLAGGPPELVTVDEATLERAARDGTHLAQLKQQQYRSAVVAPLAGRDGVLGAITFVMADSGRNYGPADLELLVELARRTGIALDNARLLAAEQRARRNAERARDRTRRLQRLTERLSGANDQNEVVAIMVSAGREALGADSGYAWLSRDETMLELSAYEHGGAPGPVDQFRVIPKSMPIPICDVFRSGAPMMFESRDAMGAAYPAATHPESPYRAWAVVPMMSSDRALGATSFAFHRERTFSDEDREMLTAVIGQASVALERSMLLASERRAREDAETARQRERQLHVLAARLSSALTPPQVATIACEEALAALHAHSGAVAVRIDDDVVMLGTGGMRDEAAVARITRVPLDAALPLAEAVRSGAVIWCATENEIASRYRHLETVWRKNGLRSWGAVPFAFEERVVGAFALAYTDERALPPDVVEFISAVGQLTVQALERARLYEAVKAGEEQLMNALAAARAGIWSVDLKTMTTTRHGSYVKLLGLERLHANTDFGHVHPADREIAERALERTLLEGVPYEPEVRVQRDDGSYMWLRSHGRLTYGPDGKPAIVSGVVVDIDEAKRAGVRAEEERRIKETLHRLGNSFAGELDHDRLVRLITVEVAKLVGAEVGAFFEGTAEGGVPALHTISVSERRNDEAVTPPELAHATLRKVVRCDDSRVRCDDGATPIARDHPAFLSYLAVPVMARAGEFFGLLVFGHPETNRFTSEHERLAAGIAGQAAVALENARLYRTVREQKEQLERAVERATIADRRKNEFLAMLGHELRNPIAPIVTVLALMELKSGGVMQSERDVIRRQVDHLSRLVDDLLDVSRITRGKVQLSRRTLELSAVLDKAIETVSPLVEKKLQRLRVDVAKSGMLVNADPTRLAQVFQNLLTNASKYSDEESQIEIVARADERRVLVEFRDQGMGVAPELVPRLFDSFVQGERALDRAEGGLGLGLTIANGLCELHGGKIDVESEGPGMGSRFTVTLSRVFEAPDGEEVRAEPDRRKPGKPRRVLVVDDNVDAAKTLHALLRELGHEPAVAHDGRIALELARSFKPDVALLDIGLPAMDGYELAGKLRRQAGVGSLRLIAITGYGQEEDRVRARLAGFDRHLVKPVAMDVLVSMLDGD